MDAMILVWVYRSKASVSPRGRDVAALRSVCPFPFSAFLLRNEIDGSFT